MVQQFTAIEKNIQSSDNFEQLKEVLKLLQQRDGLQLPELVKAYVKAKDEMEIPLSVFSNKLYPTEALCKFLYENQKYSYKQISRFLNRNEKSVWGDYQRAKKKKLKIFVNHKEKYFIPLSVFSDRKKSLMENLVSYLHLTYNLKNKEISLLLNKSPNSIAVLAKRAKIKND